MELKVEEIDRSVRHQFDVNKLFLFYRNGDIIDAFERIGYTEAFITRLKSMGWDEYDLHSPSKFTIGEMKEALLDYIMYDIRHYYKPHSWYKDSEVIAIAKALTDLGLDYEKDPFLRTFKSRINK